MGVRDIEYEIRKACEAIETIGDNGGFSWDTYHPQHYINEVEQCLESLDEVVDTAFEVRRELKEKLREAYEMRNRYEEEGDGDEW